MIRRKVNLTGASLPWAGWLLPDGTVTLSKVTLAEARAVETGARPSPSAPIVGATWLSLGWLAAIDQGDGYPLDGDCWEVTRMGTDGLPVTELHVCVGGDFGVVWSRTVTRARRDAQGRPVFDAKGAQIGDVELSVDLNARAVLTAYDQTDPTKTTTPIPTAVCTVYVQPGVL